MASGSGWKPNWACLWWRAWPTSSRLRRTLCEPRRTPRPSRYMWRKFRSGWQTLRLLYQIDRSAFLIGTFTSVVQSVVYPLILVVLWQGFSLITAGGGPYDDVVTRGAVLAGGLFGLLGLQTVLQIVNET